MGRMLEGYLAFARGDTGESTTEINVRLDPRGPARGFRAARRSTSASRRAAISTSAMRPMAMKRCSAISSPTPSATPKHVRVSAIREAQFVSIVVDDDGAGIDPAYREDVFRPFYRLDEARNQDEGGAGLGLAIARDIARSHGGDITLSDSPMGGLRAAVRIPV